MSLLGLRDMSVIETPPKDRLAIHTVVAPYQPELIRSAARTGAGQGRTGLFSAQPGGFDLGTRADIQQLVPQARISVGHGQMAEAELERPSCSSCGMSSTS